MRISIGSKWLLIAFAIVFQLLLNVQAQVVEPPTTTTNPPVTTTPKPPTSTTKPPSSPPVVPSTTLSTLQPSVPSSISVPSVPPPSSVAPTTPPAPITTPPPPSSTASSVTSSSITTSASVSPTATPKSDPPKENNTAIIVGSVVGGVVGLALIGGILACINRRGGCTKRSDNKKSDFEDYGLGDFPHHRTQAAAPVIAAAKPVSPTLPRLNDQGNYYNEDPNYGRYGYQDNNMDYGMQPQQGYYYPQQHQQQEYYDDGGYYYDSNTSATAYSNISPMQQHSQQGYVMNNNIPQTHNMAHQDVYKPDDVGSPINTGSANVNHHR